jgi:hypothetical protein
MANFLLGYVTYCFYACCHLYRFASLKEFLKTRKQSCAAERKVLEFV